MEISIPKGQTNGQITTNEGQVQSGQVVISIRPKRERELLDKDGNVIDPITKQIIKKVNEEPK